MVVFFVVVVVEWGDYFFVEFCVFVEDCIDYVWCGFGVVD